MDNDHSLLVRIDERLSNLLGRFDAHLTWSEERSKSHDGIHIGFDKRLRGLEQWKWGWTAVIAVVVFLANLLAKFF